MAKSKTTKKKKASSVNWDFSNDPFVLEKVRQGKELIAKYGLPKRTVKTMHAPALRERRTRNS